MAHSGGNLVWFKNTAWEDGIGGIESFALVVCVGGTVVRDTGYGFVYAMYCISVNYSRNLLLAP